MSTPAERAMCRRHGKIAAGWYWLRETCAKCPVACVSKDYDPLSSLAIEMSNAPSSVIENLIYNPRPGASPVIDASTHMRKKKTFVSSPGLHGHWCEVETAAASKYATGGKTSLRWTTWSATFVRSLWLTLPSLTSTYAELSAAEKLDRTSACDPEARRCEFEHAA